MGRCNKEIEALKETNMKTEEESNETELVIETSARQAGFLFEPQLFITRSFSQLA